MNGEINYFFEDIERFDFDFKAAERWLFDCIAHYQQQCTVVNFIFTSDEYLLEMNKSHLNHNYYTDIITFNYNDENGIGGDLFISVDTVRDNANELSSNFVEELKRVMIHGVLHLIGFNDKTEEEQKEMTKQENICLKMH